MACGRDPAGLFVIAKVSPVCYFIVRELDDLPEKGE
jgi:hypothetical protein